MTQHIQSWKQNIMSSIILLQLSKVQGLTHEGASGGNTLESEHVAPCGADPRFKLIFQKQM